MCGIVGIIGWYKSYDEGKTKITEMSERIHHRGPDDSGIWIDKKPYIFRP